ncbi:MAG: hypothetical protein JJT94_04090, partial [Bernardetiaceae bacterium]|nr:hypothetical protein [Bernardetiaceae bacterium]
DDDEFNIFHFRVLSFGSRNYIYDDSLKVSEQRFTDKIKSNFNFIAFSGYDSCKIELIQSQDPPDLEDKLRAEIERKVLRSVNEKIRQELGTYGEYEDKLSTKERKIMALEYEILQLSGDTIPFATIRQEVKSIYPEIDEFGIAKMRQTDFERDTAEYVAAIQWNYNVRKNKAKQDDYERRLEAFLRTKLNVRRIRIVNF